jgi:hypothetical protein
MTGTLRLRMAHLLIRIAARLVGSALGPYLVSDFKRRLVQGAKR